MATPSSRFMTLQEVGAELATTKAQVYALVRSGELAAIQIGGRRQWRVERVKLEQYIENLYGRVKPIVGPPRQT